MWYLRFSMLFLAKRNLCSVFFSYASRFLFFSRSAYSGLVALQSLRQGLHQSCGILRMLAPATHLIPKSDSGRDSLHLPHAFNVNSGLRSAQEVQAEDMYYVVRISVLVAMIAPS